MLSSRPDGTICQDTPRLSLLQVCWISEQMQLPISLISLRIVGLNLISRRFDLYCLTHVLHLIQYKHYITSLNGTIVSNLLFRPIIRILWKIEFLFHEDSQYYGGWKYCVVYLKYCAVCLKIEYSLRCLEYICSVSSPLRRHGLSLLLHH